MVILPGCLQLNPPGGIFHEATWTLDNSIHIVQPALATDVRLRGVRFSGRSFDAPAYYGYRVAYFPWTSLGVEGEFIHLKIYADVNGTIRTEGAVRGALFETRRSSRSGPGRSTTWAASLA